ncbi:hypothetical protein E1J38_007755 [Seonamhaeicola sediminis]|uniref:Carboxypeptidase-like regulatory domain-containing protein n=1 Tax=Seonamhaeicola sediminis TaxID=2528206 RepID=A0A562YEJ2_9FLAO|nr:carboxypeptidase-like regulatory domain-containing protein [Seonamhaeicola sediminis]TWO32753.1 hypothetical protein E1J38_007755 [Seonamhaeicola sediminis]
MKTQFSISINNPCKAQFNTFNKTSNGGFCNTCKTEVIDFRNMTSTELIRFLKQNYSVTCGIFKSSQMKTPSNLLIYKSKRGLSYFRALLIAAFSLVAIQNVHAQQKGTSNQVSQSIQTVQQADLLTGVVLDHENLPLPGLSIVLKGTKIGTATDFDGKYTFPEKLKEGDVLVFSFLGYSPKKVTIANNQKILNVTMQAELVELMGAIDTNRPYKSRKSIWQKVKSVF